MQTGPLSTEKSGMIWIQIAEEPREKVQQDKFFSFFPPQKQDFIKEQVCISLFLRVCYRFGRVTCLN